MPITLTRDSLDHDHGGPRERDRAPLAQSLDARFEVTHTLLGVPGLDPAHDGIRLAHLSDLRLGAGTPDARIRRAVGELARVKPDVVALTGGLVRDAASVDRVAELLEGLPDVPVLAVLGRRDVCAGAERLIAQLMRAGCVVLQNEHARVEVRGRPLCAVGFGVGVTEQEVDDALRAINPFGSRLVMAHEARIANSLPLWNDLVCVAGGTLGGRFYLRGWTERLCKTLGMPYLRGLYRVRGNHLYVSRGLGGTARWDSAPELAVLTLRAR